MQFVAALFISGLICLIKDDTKIIDFPVSPNADSQTKELIVAPLMLSSFGCGAGAS
jgi:hypothetical protein